MFFFSTTTLLFIACDTSQTAHALCSSLGLHVRSQATHSLAAANANEQNSTTGMVDEASSSKHVWIVHCATHTPL